MADGEFAPLGSLMTKLPGAPKLNLASANEHEPFVERRIRVVKERVRSLRYTLPFKTLPKNLLTHMVFFVVKLLNYFPAKGGVSDHYSPKAIMSGEVISYKQYSMPFGTYCQVHEQDTPRNSLAARTQGAISLGPSNNVQGGQKFYTLDTGKVVTRYSWTVIPMPTAVIDRVNELSKDQPTQLTFEDRQGRPIGDNDAIAYTDDSQDYEFPGVPAGDTNIPGVHDGDTVELPGVDTAVWLPQPRLSHKSMSSILPLRTNLLHSSRPTTTRRHQWLWRMLKRRMPKLQSPPTTNQLFSPDDRGDLPRGSRRSTMSLRCRERSIHLLKLICWMEIR